MPRLVLAITAAFSVAAFCPPVRAARPSVPDTRPVMSSASAAPRNDRPCDLMSPEEMRLCLATKPHQAARSVYCDKVSTSHIEGCLARQQSASAGASAPARSESSAVTFARGR